MILSNKEVARVYSQMGKMETQIEKQRPRQMKRLSTKAWTSFKLIKSNK